MTRFDQLKLSHYFDDQDDSNWIWIDYDRLISPKHGESWYFSDPLIISSRISKNESPFFKPHSKSEALANLQPWFQAASARNVPGWRVQPWVYHFGLEGFLWWPSNVRRPQRGNVGQQVASSNEWRWFPLGECDPSPQCNSAWKLKIQKDFCIAWISELVTGISKKQWSLSHPPPF